MNFYPQDGSLYRSPAGVIFRVLMTVTLVPSGAQITVYERRDRHHTWAMRTKEFGNLFKYIPNWIDYSDDEEIPL